MWNLYRHGWIKQIRHKINRKQALIRDLDANICEKKAGSIHLYHKKEWEDFFKSFNQESQLGNPMINTHFICPNYLPYQAHRFKDLTSYIHIIQKERNNI